MLITILTLFEFDIISSESKSSNFTVENSTMNPKWPICPKRSDTRDTFSCLWTEINKLFSQDFLEFEYWTMIRSLMVRTAKAISKGTFIPNEEPIFVHQFHTKIMDIIRILAVSDLFEDVIENVNQLNENYHKNGHLSADLLYSVIQNFASNENLWKTFELILQWLRSHRLNCSSYLNESSIDFPNFLSTTDIKRRSYLKPLLLECVRSKPIDPSLPPCIIGGIEYDINVSALFGLESLIAFSNTGDLDVRIYVKIHWVDFRRMWVPGNFSGLSYVELSAGEIWHPTFHVVRCISYACYLDPRNESSIILYHTGVAVYTHITRISVSCEMSLWNFPFDRQNCSIKVFSFQKIQVQEIKEELLYSEFETEEWIVRSISLDQSSYSFESKSHIERAAYPAVEMIINFERVPVYYLQNLIFPVVLISLIGLCIILFSPDSVERLNTAITVLLGFLFLQTIIATLIPKTAIQPNVAKYCIYAIVTSSYAVIYCTAVLAICQIKHPKEPPACIQLVVVQLLGLILFHRVKRNFLLIKGRFDHLTHSLSLRRSKKRSKQNKREPSFINKTLNFPEKVQAGENEPGGEIEKVDKEELNYYVDELKKLEGSPGDHNDPEFDLDASDADDWSQVAIVLNRLGNIIYVTASLIIFFVYLYAILP